MLDTTRVKNSKSAVSTEKPSQLKSRGERLNKMPKERKELVGDWKGYTKAEGSRRNNNRRNKRDI